MEKAEVILNHSYIATSELLTKPFIGQVKLVLTDGFILLITHFDPSDTAAVCELVGVIGTSLINLNEISLPLTESGLPLPVSSVYSQQVAATKLAEIQAVLANPLLV